MPHRNCDLRISDIIDAIENALDYSAGMTFEQFAEDRKTIDAVVRNFMVIGEAATHLPEDFIEKHPDLPWREMRDMRNIDGPRIFRGRQPDRMGNPAEKPAASFTSAEAVN